ncbi:Protein-tyrosine kinase [Candidatus Methylobacter favarea]|uniref:Protein-tyrosine kinase n=1 Tax=Candidatus Methylobacter favarea TaxID=2707345 RepID=A0A8S0X8N1_9GAMM|nr:polysaccharide biosynthesis tyrosine autokinase [Candidatus Methylobacter favarea]CAA9891280.1 Protein-tyrosine kinase [Candidatus Methylobacter favarea]
MQKPFFDNSNLAVNYLPNEKDDKVDLSEIIAILLDNKWLIALTTAVVLAIGTAKVFIDRPVYKSDAMLQVEAQSQALRTLEPGVSIQKTEIPVMAEVELINSRMVLGEAIRNLGLSIIAKPKYFPIIGEAIARHYEQSNKDNKVSNAFLGRTQYAWGGESIRVDAFMVPSNWLNKKFILMAASKQGHFQLMLEGELILEGEVGKLASKQLKGEQQSLMLFVPLLKARPGTEFTVMRLSEDKAINELKENLLVTEKGKLTRILELTLEADKPELAVQILNQIVNIYIRQNVEKKSAEAQKTLEFLNEQMPLLKERLAEATTALNDYRTRQGSIDLDLETQGILKGVVELKTEITKLQQQRDELRQKFTESHPSIVSVDKQIARLQGQMNNHEQKIEALPETQQVILKLARDVQVNTELYTTLLNNSQTLRVAKAGAVPDVRIIDYAISPTLPIKPKKVLIMAFSLILGLILGIALTFIRKALRRGIEDPDLIEKELHIPVYASIPHSVDQEKLNKKIKINHPRKVKEPLILAVQNKEDLAIESLRSLRTTLHFAFLEAQNNIIMITGPSPGVGKTFVCINLAVVLAEAGKKILLIDGDMRKGFINKIFDIGRENGLSELISNTISGRAPKWDVTIHKTPIVNLDFIPSGSIPPNPSELLLHERFGHLLENISKNYDHVIIDSPPILAVTDAAIIGRRASATLMVVRAGQHPMRELEQSVKRLTQGGVPLKGVVFNDLPKASSRYGYGYGQYKYIYQYSYNKAN